MTKTIHVTLLIAGTFNGALLEKGDVIELPEKSANALINEGGAKVVEGLPSQEAIVSDLSDDKGEGTQTPTTDPEEPTADSRALLTKALDDKYVSRIPELKEHAKEADVQFAHDATKGEIIEAVIEAGLGDVILAK